MCQALAEMVAAAVAHGCYGTEEHLRPAEDGEELAKDAVGFNEIGANAAIYASLKVEFEVDP